jgi:hypothetical protein
LSAVTYCTAVSGKDQISCSLKKCNSWRCNREPNFNSVLLNIYYSSKVVASKHFALLFLLPYWRHICHTVVPLFSQFL